MCEQSYAPQHKADNNIDIQINFFDWIISTFIRVIFKGHKICLIKWTLLSIKDRNLPILNVLQYIVDDTSNANYDMI